jgi:Kef-type K+ transport system membrane component KefB
MNLILALGIILGAGLVASLASRKVGLPSITGYIIVGVLLGPSAGGVIPAGVIADLDIITSITLGVVAYLIGGSLRIESLRGLGKGVAWITPLQSLGAAILVTAVVVLAVGAIRPEAPFWQFTFPLALIVGAISSATAPAATMAVVRELRAKGPLTTTLLAVVALDDGVAVVAFAVAVGVCTPLVAMDGGFSFYNMIAVPVLEIVGSVGLGLVMAAGPVYIGRLVRSRDGRLALVFGTVMLCSGLAIELGLSLIIANMMLGFVVVNVLRDTAEPSVLGEMETILFTLFFVLAGLHFDLAVLGTAGLLALLIVVSRCAGKYGGSVLGATIAAAPAAVKRYLGLALLPKAGVTVGLALLAATKFPEFGGLLLNVVLASTIVNELIAPPLARLAIVKAGEAHPREL